MNRYTFKVTPSYTTLDDSTVINLEVTMSTPLPLERAKEVIRSRMRTLLYPISNNLVLDMECIDYEGEVE
jgi:hypothetical protein